MRIASRAPNLGAFHQERVVGTRDDILRCNRLPEARPSSARIEFGLRAEQRRSAANASVEPLRVQFVILIHEWPLSAPLAGHIVLLGGKSLFPFGVAFDDLGERSEADRSTGIIEFRDRY